MNIILGVALLLIGIVLLATSIQIALMSKGEFAEKSIATNNKIKRNRLFNSVLGRRSE